MKKAFYCILCLLLCLCAIPVPAEQTGLNQSASYAILIDDLVRAYLTPSAEAIADAEEDRKEISNAVGDTLTSTWERLWIYNTCPLYLYGTDDPAELPITGRHAFVILGYQLQNGEMTEELKGRCDAAAAAAQAFPASYIVCSGGATGENNPDGHTEAGMMKQYLTEVHGISPDRILTDEQAMTTAENALYTMEILDAENIDSITIVTSDYHQKRGQTLYAAMAAKYALESGHQVIIEGNFNYPVDKDASSTQNDVMITVMQLAEILDVPRDMLSSLTWLRAGASRGL